MSDPVEAGNRRGAGELASEVLGILQSAGEPLAPADVRERLGGDLAYTTVVTILSRLHAKGVLDRERAGRAFRYSPVADEPGLAARRMARRARPAKPTGRPCWPGSCPVYRTRTSRRCGGCLPMPAAPARE